MMNEVSEHEVQRIVRKPYHRLITGEPVEGYLGEVLELPAASPPVRRPKRHWQTSPRRWKCGSSPRWPMAIRFLSRCRGLSESEPNLCGRCDAWVLTGRRSPVSRQQQQPRDKDE